MTITVYTDHGIFDYPDADEFQVDTNDDRLDVNKDGDRIAMFNRGDWQHVEINEDEPPADPREWDSLADVPPGVTVQSQSKASLIDGQPLRIRRLEDIGSKYKWEWQSKWSGPWFGPGQLAQADAVWSPYVEVIS